MLEIKTITRAPRGTAREVIKLDEVQIPDLWHTATLLNDLQDKAKSHSEILLADRDIDVLATHSNNVLKCWHLCHDLLENLRNPELIGIAPAPSIEDSPIIQNMKDFWAHQAAQSEVG